MKILSLRKTAPVTVTHVVSSPMTLLTANYHSDKSAQLFLSLCDSCVKQTAFRFGQHKCFLKGVVGYI